jgi:capsular polysaccharide transport system permease protein
MSFTTRSSVSITFSAWKALLLRETVNRLASGRAAWVWILLEPLVHVLFMSFMFSAVRVNSVGGIDATIWLMIGMLAFFTFRRTSNQCMNAIGANRALFTYRQVKPVDTVLVRAGTEGFLMFLVFVILFAGLGLFGHNIVPSDPLALISAVAGLWLSGLGFGLVTSVAVVLIPELGRIIGFILTPLYLMSGVMVQIGAVPEPYRSWLALNPLVHGIESARFAFAPYYHTISGLSISYLYAFALVLIFLGLAMHVRFANRMVMQ